MMLMRPDVDQLALPESLSPQDRDHIRRASRYLREQGAARVWLFGSLARGRLPTVHSDFDFAVEGLPPTRHFGCLGHLLQVLPRPVDLVDMACCPVMRGNSRSVRIRLAIAEKLGTTPGRLWPKGS